MSVEGTSQSCDFVATYEKNLKISKRIFDILFSSLALLFGLPLFLLCAIAVRVSSRGPVFFGSKRVGLAGEIFSCWKFRTMYQDAENKLAHILLTNEALSAEWKTFFKLKDDPRITPIGKWLRKTSLDELPQFWNVLKGDMSIVGPRPLSETEVQNYLGKKAGKILSVRPGLTTIWAVRGRNELTLAERTRLEVFYVEHQSFWFDCQLIIKTALSMIYPKGAY